MALRHGAWSDKQDEVLATTHRFSVVVDVPRFHLGAWSKVSGLGFKIAQNPIKELGVNNFQYQQLDTPTWTPIVMTRAVVLSQGGADWEPTYEFIMHSLNKPASAHSLVIEMQNAWGDVMRRMTFHGARLTEWKGPSLEAGAGKGGVAEEQLTFVHDGLFPHGGNAA